MSDNYTKLHNEVLDAIMKQDLSGAEFRVIIAIWRKTYGFHKKADSISISQILESTGLLRRTIERALKSLSREKIITRSGMVTGFSKEFLRLKATKWSDDENDDPTKMSQNTDENVATPPTKMSPTKEIYKERKKYMQNNSLDSKVVSSHSDYRPNPIVNSSKNLEPLPYEKLWEIAMKKNVSLFDTKKTHQSILDSIENGDKYKVKNISLTLQKWIDLGIGRGNIQQLEEIGRMILEDQSPEKIAEHRLYGEAAKYLNSLPIHE